MSGTSNAELYWQVEASAGGGYVAGNIHALNFVSFTMDEAIDYSTSPTINPSREVKNRIRGRTRVAGQQGGMLAYDTRLVSQLKWLTCFDGTPTASSTWTLSTISFVSEENEIIDDSFTMKLQTGDWISVRDSVQHGDFFAKVCEGWIEGTWTAYTATLTARSGTTAGTTVVGATSGAIGEVVAIDTGAPKTIRIRVISGVFTGETIEHENGGASGSVTAFTYTRTGGVLSGINLTTEASGASIVVKRNPTYTFGKTLKTSFYEQKQPDASPVSYEYCDYVAFSRLSFNIPEDGGGVPYTLDFITGAAKQYNTASVATGHNDPSTRQEFAAAENFYGFFMGGPDGRRRSLAATDNSATTVCTTSVEHGLYTNDVIIIDSNADADNNDTWVVTRIDEFTFSLQGSTAQTAQTGTNAGYFRHIKREHAIVSGRMTMNSSLRERTRADQREPSGIVIGTADSDLEIVVYFDDDVFAQRFSEGLETSVALVFQDTATDPSLFMVFELMSCKIVAAPAPVSGNNDERRYTISFASQVDSTENAGSKISIN